MFLTLKDLSKFASISTATKYTGICKQCEKSFDVGTDMKWLQPIGPFHIDCYERYASFESGLEEVLELLLKSTSQAKQKLIQTLTHCNLDRLYSIIGTLVDAEDHDNVIELLNNIRETENDWYLQIVLGSCYFSKGNKNDDKDKYKRFTEMSIDRSIAILSSKKVSSLGEVKEWRLGRHIRNIETFDKEKILSLIELLLAINPDSRVLNARKANLSTVGEALSIDNTLLNQAVDQWKWDKHSIKNSVKTEGSGNAMYELFNARFTKTFRCARTTNPIKIAKRYASPNDSELLFPFLFTWYANTSADEFFKKYDQVNTKQSSSLFDVYLAILVANEPKQYGYNFSAESKTYAGNPFIVHKCCLEFLRLVGPTPYDEIFEIKDKDDMILSSNTILYDEFVHQNHIHALLESGKKIQALKTFFTRLGNSNDEASIPAISDTKLLDKLLDAWKEFFPGPFTTWFNQQTFWSENDERRNRTEAGYTSLKRFCTAILKKFPNNEFALAKLNKTTPEKSASPQANITEQVMREKSFDEIGKYSGIEGQNLEFKASYFLSESDKSKITGTDAQKAIQSKEKSIQKEVSESVSAFMNTNKGEVLLGIADDRKFVGVEGDIKRCGGSEDKYIQKVKNNLKSHLNDYPGLFQHVDFKFKTATTSNKTFFSIAVKPVPKKNKLVYCNEVVFVREAESDQSKKGEALEELIVSRRT